MEISGHTEALPAADGQSNRQRLRINCMEWAQEGERLCREGRRAEGREYTDGYNIHCRITMLPTSNRSEDRRSHSIISNLCTIRE